METPIEYFGIDTLTFDCWQAWFANKYKGGGAYSVFFRPPLEVLSELASVSEIFVDTAEPHTTSCGMYNNWYARAVYHPGLLLLSLVPFWLKRSAEVFLPLLADCSCAYIRIQFEDDHAQPPWWFNRHANVALNAAWDDGANPHVFYADTTYAVGSQSPTQLRGALEEIIDQDSFDPDDHSSWPEWPNDSHEQLFYQLDLLRWAYETSFRLAARAAFDPSWEPYDARVQSLTDDRGPQNSPYMT